MSFFSYKNCDREQCPGSLTPADCTRGLVEKVCINVHRVFDSCISQEPLENLPITITEFGSENPNPVPPFNFISCRSTTTRGVLENVDIEPLPDRCHFARIRATVEIPIEIFFEDANGTPSTGIGVITINKDVILCVPEEAVIPYSLENIVSAVCVCGTYAGGTTFICSVCATVILKIVADVELLIPTYGYCPIPPCEDFASELCDQFFSLPIFPRQRFDEC
jgi:hypothetical protein